MRLKPRYFMPDTDTMLSPVAPSMLTSFYEPPLDFVWSDLGQVATIAAESTADARMIKGLAWYEGVLWLGYGDYSGNTGPCNAIYWDGAAYQTAYSNFATEAFWTMRAARGDLFCPAIDPRVQYASDYLRCDGLVCTDAVNDPPKNIHAFDIASHPNGSTLVLVGATGVTPASAIWASTDDGATWTLVDSDTAYDRCYGIGYLNGFFWTMKSDLQTAVTSNALKSADGITWSDAGFKLAANSTFNHFPVLFNGKLVHNTQDPQSGAGFIRAFDGTQVASSPGIPNLSGGAGADTYYGPCVGDGYLWVLRAGATGPGQVVWRTADLSTWTTPGTFTPGTGRSIEVHDGAIYIGTSNSRVYRTTYGDPAGVVWVDGHGSQWIGHDGDTWISS